MTARLAREPASRIAFRFTHGVARGPACHIEMGRGGAPALLFLHGFGGDLLTWQYCLAPFADRFRVLALDLPGHGRSTPDVGGGSLAEMVAWVAGFLDALDLAAAHLVGHSMGAKIAIGLALASPGRVAGLSLISPAGLGGYVDLALLRRFRDCAVPGTAEAIARRLLGPAAPPHLLPGLVRALEAPGEIARQGARERLLDSAGAIGAGLSERGVPWERIGCPIQVIWGGADTVLPVPGRDRLPPGVPVEILPRVGHLPQLEAPGSVASLIEGFLS